MTRIFFLLILFFCSSQVAVSQSNSTEKPRLQFQHLIEGLNNERITNICQDEQGFIWIGTYNGLHKYDGIKFRIYLSNSKQNTIPDNRIEKMFSDSKGNLWIGTANSICRYNRKHDDFIRYTIKSGLVDETDPAPNRITTIIEDEKGTIWVGSEKEGLLYFDEEKQEFISYFTTKTGLGLSSIHVKEICMGKSDEMWIGLENGLNKLNLKTKKVTNFPFQSDQQFNIEGENLRGMARSENGDLWIGTKANGLFLLKEENQATKTFENFKHDPNNENTLGNNSIYSIFIDSKNQLWVGNENGGLALFNAKDKSFFRYLPDPKDPFSVSNNSIWSIFEDKHGRIWIGTGLKGVNILDKNFVKFTHHYSSPLNEKGLSNNLTRAFIEDKKGNVFIATDGGGLNYWNRSKNAMTHFTYDPNNPNSISSNAILDLSWDTQGRLWSATWAGNVSILTDAEKMHFKKLSELESNDPITTSIYSSFSLLKDKNGNLWSGNYQKGLSYHNLNDKTSQIFVNDPKDKSSIGANTLYCLFEDSKGNVWAGGETNGLNKMIKGEDGNISFKRYTFSDDEPRSIAGDIVNQIYEDSKNNIWVATSGGLSKLEEKTDDFVNYTTEQGLPSDFVVSVIEDEEGYLWVGSEKGLSKFDPEKGTFRNFSKSDGLQGDKFSRHTVLTLSTGELMFGGSNGFNIFYPAEVKDNPYKPEIYITDLKLFNKSVLIGENDSLLKADISLTKEITLQYHQNVLSLDFVALNYTHPTKNQYAYKLEGLEDEWNYVGNMQTATYTNLDPGSYTFKVKAANNDGIWNEEGTQLQIVVLPPWYKTWWFYTLSAIILFGIVFTFIKIREKQLKEDKAVLARAIEEKTQELEKKAAEIIARDEADKVRNWTALGLNQFTEIVNKNKEDINNLAQNILSNLIKFLEASQGTVTILNDDDENDQYLEMIATYAHEEGKRANTRFDFNQGLLGTCFTTGEVNYIDNLPEGYSKLCSGLGETRLKYLLLVPLKLDEFIIGVVEISSYKPIQEHEIQFVQKLGEIITSSLYTLRVSRKTTLLLEQSRSHAEELQAQEEEIRQNMEEMEAIQEDFLRRERELTEKLRQTEEENEKIKKELQNKTS